MDQRTKKRVAEALLKAADALEPKLADLRITAADPREAGFLLGKRLADQISTTLRSAEEEAAPEWLVRGWELAKTETPRAFAFVEGMAEGSGAPIAKLFKSWYEELSFANEDDKTALKDFGCTDVVFRSPDITIIGHNNDEGPPTFARVVRLEIADLPVVTCVFGGDGPSVAVNSAGLVFSGNQVDATDTKPGVPRLFIFLEACWSPDMKTAEQVILNPNRSSSYNYILSDQTGQVVTLEASSNDRVKKYNPHGTTAHTNHFLWLTQHEGREGVPLESSELRLENALQSAEQAGRTLSVKDVQEFLSSHDEGGLCRHIESDKAGAETAFSIIFMPKERQFLFAPKHPCENNYSLYSY